MIAGDINNIQSKGKHMTDKIIVDAEFEKLIPPLTPDEYAQLEQNLLADGCQDSLKVWRNDGNIILIDGHNRLKICNEHGLKYNVEELVLPDRDAAMNWMDANQLGRRNLTRELMSKIRGRRYNREKKQGKRTDLTCGNNYQKSTTAETLAKEYGVTEKTIRNDGKFAEECEQDPELDNTVMTRGDVKKYKKKKAAEQKKKEQQKAVNSIKKIPKDERYKIYKADINTAEPVCKADYIITDPPYKKEYLPMYEVLAQKANDWLAPGGLLIAMCGESYLPKIYEMMCRHVDYYWTACYFTPGQPKPLRQVNVNCVWKPLLIFTKKNDTYRGKIFIDVFRSEQNEKDHHEWGQSVSGMYDIVSKICIPGKNILDPFLGGGSTAIAALRHKCLFEGFDIDEQNIKITLERLLNDKTKE